LFCLFSIYYDATWTKRHKINTVKHFNANCKPAVGLGVGVDNKGLGGKFTMSTITKKELVERISNSTGQTKIRTKETVQLFLDAITEELEKGNRIELRDFGVFEVKSRADRVGRNPRTGETVKVPARKVVTFKVGRKMKINVKE